MKIRKLLAALGIAGLLAAPSGHAAFITLPEAAMDAVFSQASFGTNTIDIRFGAATTIVAPTLLDLDTATETDDIFALHVGAANVVNFYFIDTMSFCGSASNDNFIGCGETPGQDFVVESAFAAGANGHLLLSHELSHNLGLPHNGGGSTFLMHPFLDGGSLLDASEVTAILTSPLVQTDTDGRLFILINPVLIVAEAVPEPSTMLLLAMGLALAGTRSRRQFFG